MFQAPTQPPDINTLIDGLPTHNHKQIARHLGVSARTLARWVSTGNAPRVAHLALFWETRWGLSVAHCKAEEGERVALAWARSLERQTALLRARVAYLEQAGDFGSANSPFWDEHPREGPRPPLPVTHRPHVPWPRVQALTNSTAL